MTLIKNGWLLSAYILTLLSSSYWPKMPNVFWCWVPTLLLVCAFRINRLRYITPICIACIIALLHGNLMKWQSRVIFRSGSDTIINAQVDSFFKQNSYGYSGNIRVSSVGQIKISQWIQPRVKLYSPIPLNPGEHIYFHMSAKSIIGLLNEAGFDSESYYFSQRIVAKAYVTKNSEYTVINQPSFRMRLYQHVKQLLHEHPYQGLLLALSFADRTGLTDEQWHQLKASGLAHLVAISGLHIGIAYAFGFYLGGGISRIHPLLLWFPVVLGTGCAGFYAWLAGFSLPTQRALCMVLIHVFLRMAHIRVETSWRFLITLACLLTINPFSGISVGFWLSFSAVFFVLYFMRLANDEPSGLGYWLRHHMRLMVCMLSPSSYLLGGISVVSPLYNLVFIPWFSVLVIPVLFLALLLSAIDYPNVVFVWELIRYLLMPLIWSIRLAGGMWCFMSESMTNVLLFLTLLMVLKPVLSTRSLYFSLLMTIGYLIESQHVAGWRVDVLDVGHGLAILIEKNHHNVLYDTGKQWQGGSIAQSVIDPVLHLRGAGQLDGLILSHMDNDHAGGRVWIAEHWHFLWMRSSQSLKGK